MTVRRRVVRHDTSTATVSARPDTLAVEEPLEVRLGGRPFSVTMRTPGHDVDLAIGFLAGEGVVAAPDDLSSVQAMGAAVDVRLAPHVPPPDPSLERHVFTTSACGVCGSASLEAVDKVARFDVAADATAVRADVLAGLPDTLRASQGVFDRTGGVHAAGLFTAEGTLVVLREDVGRHNAVDKVVGWALREGRLPLAGHVLQVSGRASFELVQKARLAGVPVLAAVSAPSSLAVELAEDAGMTLVGFSRGGRFTVYTGDSRVTAS
ncbi:formate dehydrogenase accessory sulfurtransferase FdhD [Aquipuribacter sp. SD81]|uniref:formate dehydrogenase accessory sulfurtransferase FdhD n=1 Tax=Aquipuribacter sp. SD81 TaxID=3127703 RepID=UPI003016DD1F